MEGKNHSGFEQSFYGKIYLELQHFQAPVSELKQSQCRPGQAQGIDHESGHVSGAQATGRHCAHLEERVQDAGQHLWAQGHMKVPPAGDAGLGQDTSQ